MKKLLCLISILVLTFSFFGCKKGANPSQSSQEQSSISSVVSSTSDVSSQENSSVISSAESSQKVSSEISSIESSLSNSSSQKDSSSSTTQSSESSKEISSSSSTQSSESSKEISSSSSTQSSVSSQETSSSSSSVELSYGYTYQVVGKSNSLVEVSVFVNGEKVTRLEKGQTYTLVVKATNLITNPLAKIKVNGTYILDVEASGSHYYESHDTFTSGSLICEGDVVIEIYVVSSSPFM